MCKMPKNFWTVQQQMKSKEENMVSQNNLKLRQWMQNGASWEIQFPKLNMELVQKN